MQGFEILSYPINEDRSTRMLCESGLSLFQFVASTCPGSKHSSFDAPQTAVPQMSSDLSTTVVITVRSPQIKNHSSLFFDLTRDFTIADASAAQTPRIPHSRMRGSSFQPEQRTKTLQPQSFVLFDSMAPSISCPLSEPSILLQAKQRDGT